jgi:integrase
LSQTKTSLPIACQLRPATLSAIRRHLGGRTAGPVWLWPWRREAFYRRFRRLVATAAIRPGTFRWLRRSAATACERVAPGTGQLLLGHASRATTEVWYLDRSQLGQPPLPPL